VPDVGEVVVETGDVGAAAARIRIMSSIFCSKSSWSSGLSRLKLQKPNIPVGTA
jgi:hypothetical protein